MGRRNNNPDLVEELIDGRWTMSQEEFETKYYSLSSSDMSQVADAIDGMESEFLRDENEDDYETLNVYDAADIWMSNGKDEDYMFGYTREELENAL